MILSSFSQLRALSPAADGSLLSRAASRAMPLEVCTSRLQSNVSSTARYQQVTLSFLHSSYAGHPLHAQPFLQQNPAASAWVRKQVFLTFSLQQATTNSPAPLLKPGRFLLRQPTVHAKLTPSDMQLAPFLLMKDYNLLN